MSILMAASEDFGEMMRSDFFCRCGLIDAFLAIVLPTSSAVVFHCSEVLPQFAYIYATTAAELISVYFPHSAVVPHSDCGTAEECGTLLRRRRR